MTVFLGLSNLMPRRSMSARENNSGTSAFTMCIVTLSHMCLTGKRIMAVPREFTVPIPNLHFMIYEVFKFFYANMTAMSFVLALATAIRVSASCVEHNSVEVRLRLVAWLHYKRKETMIRCSFE